MTATAIATPVVTVLPRSRGGLGGAHGGGSPRPAPVVEAEIVSEPAHASLAAISTATGFFRAPTRIAGPALPLYGPDASLRSALMGQSGFLIHAVV